MRLPTASAALVLLACAALAGCGWTDPEIRAPFTGELAKGNHPHSITTNVATFSPDGSLLATGRRNYDNDKHEIQLWDATTGAAVGPPITDHTDTVHDLAFSPDSTTLASASGDGTLRLWNVADRAPLGTPIAATGRGGVRAVSFSPNGQTLATAGEDGAVRLWNVDIRKQLGAPFLGHRDHVTDVAFSPDGHTLGTASRDGTVQLWHVDTRTPYGPPLATGPSQSFMAFSPDGRYLAAASLHLQVFDLANRNPVASWDSNRYDGAWGALVDGLYFSPDGGTVLFAVSELLNGPNIATPPVNATPNYVGGYSRHTLRALDFATGKERATPVLSGFEQFSAAAYSPDGRRIAWGTSVSAGVIRVVG
ncbi:WD40 repeat domain-containing protein [Longispora sp. NPDC051575]|uniref:WD40 repeat domain-containing protein n=1 Tax=Longispora sp. NPDC051575 TaxID=3154943 RepID=UPI00342B9CED